MSGLLHNVASPQFGYVLLTATGIALQCVVHGFRFPGSSRGAVFKFDREAAPDKKRIDSLVEDHKRATGEAGLPKEGYPDMGTGRFSELLPYEAWYKFALNQRVHYNYVEGVASAITLNVIAGCFFPRYAAALGGAYMLGREVFAAGYVTAGAKGRIYGAILLDLALLGLLCVSQSPAPLNCAAGAFFFSYTTTSLSPHSFSSGRCLSRAPSSTRRSCAKTERRRPRARANFILRAIEVF